MEEIATTEANLRGPLSNKVANGDKRNSPVKRGRGRPPGSKKLKVCVTDVEMTALILADSNGGPAQPQRGRGRPKLSVKNTKPQKPGDGCTAILVQSPSGRGRPKGSKNPDINQNSLIVGLSPKKGGRPKKSTNISKVSEDLLNGDSKARAPKRGCPRGSKGKSETCLAKEDKSVTARNRGGPKCPLNNETRTVNNRKVEGVVTQRRQGRPRKRTEKKSISVGTEASHGIKRGRGRPKASSAKKPPAYRVCRKVGRPFKLTDRSGRMRKLGQAPQQPRKRGRPRKNPRPSPAELRKPKVWKPLGRPRKYPRVESPEGAAAIPRRTRGRPRKLDSKKGAHLRKNLPTTSIAAQKLSNQPRRKRGRLPSSLRNEYEIPRKRGRPKGSVNKSKAGRDSKQKNALANRSEAGSDLADAAKDMTEQSTTHTDDTEEQDIGQNASLDGDRTR